MQSMIKGHQETQKELNLIEQIYMILYLLRLNKKQDNVESHIENQNTITSKI